MKNVARGIAVILTITAILACSGEKIRHTREVQEALNDWEAIYERAQMHQGALREMKKIIRRANGNYSVLVEISRMISEIPFHTEVLLKVADSAAKAGSGRVDFLSLAELGIIKLSESKKVIDLAEYASRLEPEESLERYESLYDRLRETAEASSIEEAVVMVEDNIRRLQQQASEM